MQAFLADAAEAQWNAYPGIAVPSTCLEQEYPHLAILAQPVGQDATR